MQSNSIKSSDAPAQEGIIVTNPPYGVRISEQQELAELYSNLDDALKQKFTGWRAYLLSADGARRNAKQYVRSPSAEIKR